MLATPYIDVRTVKNVGKTKELRVPATIFSSVHPNKSLHTTAVVDTGAGATFIHWMFVRKHGIKTHKLEKPFSIRTADGKTSEKKCTHYCHLAMKIDDRLMIGKFNIMNMSDRDMILLGKPWLSAMNPDINWTEDTLRLSPTPRSLRLEKIYRKKWGFTVKTPKALQHSPLPVNGKRTLERRSRKRKSPLFYPTQMRTPFPNMTPKTMSGMTPPLNPPSHGRSKKQPHI